MVTREREVYDSFGRRQVVPVRTYRDRRGFVLSPKFVFIDGETGAQLYTRGFREEILYDSSQNTPALSSLFRVDGPAVALVPGVAERPERPGHADPAQIGTPPPRRASTLQPGSGRYTL